MGLMYAWATPDYLLWNMTIGQIIMYHELGIDIKYPDPKKNTPGLVNKSTEELRKMRDDARAQFELEKRESLEKEMSSKYGAIS